MTRMTRTDGWINATSHVSKNDPLTLPEIHEPKKKPSSDPREGETRPCCKKYQWSVRPVLWPVFDDCVVVTRDDPRRKARGTERRRGARAGRIER